MPEFSSWLLQPPVTKCYGSENFFLLPNTFHRFSRHRSTPSLLSGLCASCAPSSLHHLNCLFLALAIPSTGPPPGWVFWRQLGLWKKVGPPTPATPVVRTCQPERVPSIYIESGTLMRRSSRLVANAYIVGRRKFLFFSEPGAARPRDVPFCVVLSCQSERPRDGLSQIRQKKAQPVLLIFVTSNCPIKSTPFAP